jgi:hypothetical protein
MGFKNQLFILLTGVILFSCSPYKQLYKDFNGNKTSIDYIHTTELVKAKKRDVTICIAKPIIRYSRFTVGEVRKISSEIIPLIIYNGWNHKYECSIGKNQIKENLDTFIQAAFLEEINRSSSFKADTISKNKFSIEIEVDSISSRGPFVNSGEFIYLFIAYMSQTREEAGPGVAYSRLHYKVRKSDKVVLEDYVSTQSTFELLRPNVLTFKKFHSHYRANLIESLSDTLKKNIEQITKHLEILFEDESIFTQ